MTRPSGLTHRQRRMWNVFDFSTGQGLEIGPLYAPMARRQDADVRYVDIFTREELLAAHAHQPQDVLERIPETDVLLRRDGRVVSIPEAAAGHGPFDWVIASHVIEHTPDLVGWLEQIAEVTTDGGALVLAVPDRRYCFDLHRPPTTVGQLLEAHERGDAVPSVRAVYDFVRSQVTVSPEDAWAGRVPDYSARPNALERVQELVAQARTGAYCDSHVWLFTPDSLVEQLAELRALGLSSWRVEQVQPTRKGQLEFFAVLRRLPRDGDWPAELFTSEPAAAADLPDWLVEHAALRTEVAALRAELRRAERLGGRLEQRLRDIDGSWRWRVGGAVVRPAPALRRAVGRGVRPARPPAAAG